LSHEFIKAFGSSQVNQDSPCTGENAKGDSPVVKAAAMNVPAPVIAPAVERLFANNGAWIISGVVCKEAIKRSTKKVCRQILIHCAENLGYLTSQRSYVHCRFGVGNRSTRRNNAADFPGGIFADTPRTYADAKAVWLQSRNTAEYQGYAAEFAQFNNHFPKEKLASGV
jgi:hypothetical protein